MKKQVIFIHGGITFLKMEDFYKYLRITEITDPFKSKKTWTDSLSVDLGENYEVMKPNMPFKYGADYEGWKIWFERHFDFIRDDGPILIGHSLGGTFLLKYLSENNFPKKIYQLHLVAPAVFDEDDSIEKLSTFKFDVKKITKIQDICEEIHLWHSEDDNMVPFKNSEIVNENLSKANFHILKDRGHFNQPSFPEILEVIKKAK